MKHINCLVRIHYLFQIFETIQNAHQSAIFKPIYTFLIIHANVLIMPCFKYEHTPIGIGHNEYRKLVLQLFNLIGNVHIRQNIANLK